MSQLTLSEIRKSYGETEVIRGLDLAVEAGEFIVFVGPSGCGKSTLLRTIAGLEGIDTGRIEIAGRDATRLPPVERNVAMVFQGYALYPHLTVAENIAFGLKIRNVPKPQRRARAEEIAGLLRLEPYLDRRPAALSGGQRQRVAIGRALARSPEIFLFDEPLSNLDAELRVEMRIEIARLHRELGNTMIYVTHDQTEAMTLADRIVVLNGGRIEQVGRPLELYNDPANAFVAGFIGSPKINLVETGRLPLPQAPEVAAQIGIRPEHLRIDPEGPINAEVLFTEDLGNLGFSYLDAGGTRLCVETRGARPAPGDRLRLSAEPAQCLYFDAQGQRLRHPQ